jgi:hypothetical protein
MPHMMMRKVILSGLLVMFACVVGDTRASLTLPLPVERHLRLAQAVCRGTVVGVECFRGTNDGHLYTSASVQVDEVFKGRFPAIVKLTHRGGALAGRGEVDGWSPRFQAGEERLLFLVRGRDGTLHALDGAASAVRLHRTTRPAAGSPSEAIYVPADASLLAEVRRLASRNNTGSIDVSDQVGTSHAGLAEPASLGAAPSSVNTTNLLIDSNGRSSRFPVPDRGEPIPYRVDADAVPSGMSLTEAISTVRNAFDAWAAVTSLKFTFEGVFSFGAPARDLAASGDGKIYIQLHDLYGYITGPNTLGQGGRYSAWNSLAWGLGGSVAGNEFNESPSGYLTIKHTQPVLQDVATLTEVLCHELGHVFSVGHSSETYPESDATLREAMMYAFVHADGRGATLGTWDPPVIGQVFPAANTPPYTCSRVMDIVTLSSGAPNITGVNEIRLRGYDLQTTNLTLMTTNATANNGTFSLVGNQLKFTPAASYQSPRLDPARGEAYDLIAFRYSDGTNASVPGTARVISFDRDRSPSGGGDGIPDSWMVTYWGNANPAAGPNRGASADFDGDGFTNLQEYWLGSNPTNQSSNLRMDSIEADSFQWKAKPWELYEVLSSPNLQTWTRVLNPVLPTNSPAVVTGLTHLGPGPRFFRVVKMP